MSSFISFGLGYALVVLLTIDLPTRAAAALLRRTTRLPDALWRVRLTVAGTCVAYSVGFGGAAGITFAGFYLCTLGLHLWLDLRRARRRGA